jgi:hypothetical protein
LLCRVFLGASSSSSLERKSLLLGIIVVGTTMSSSRRRASAFILQVGGASLVSKHTELRFCLAGSIGALIPRRSTPNSDLHYSYREKRGVCDVDDSCTPSGTGPIWMVVKIATECALLRPKILSETWKCQYGYRRNCSDDFVGTIAAPPSVHCIQPRGFRPSSPDQHKPLATPTHISP